MISLLSHSNTSGSTICRFFESLIRYILPSEISFTKVPSLNPKVPVKTNLFNCLSMVLIIGRPQEATDLSDINLNFLLPLI